MPSKMEQRMMDMLDIFDIEYMYDSPFDGLSGDRGLLRFDFIIPTNDESYFFLEMQGKQHYKPVKFNENQTWQNAQYKFKKQQRYDLKKKEYCKDKGYPLLCIKYNETRNFAEVLFEFIYKHNIAINPYNTNTAPLLV